MEAIKSLVPYQKQIEATISRARRLKEDPAIQKWPGLVVLLDEFAKFASDYVFVLSYTTDKPYRRLALNKGIEQLLDQWNILSRACEQRHEEVPEPASFVPYLRAAEERLQGYSKRWHPPDSARKHYMLLATSSVVYFEKLYGIARTLYAPDIPIISIPLTYYNDPSQWQALAHEFGHHLYWNALDFKSTNDLHVHLRQAVADAIPASDSQATRRHIWEGWVEEVFADICSTLLLGPGYADSAQQQGADTIDPATNLIDDDTEHPSAYLRPLISLQILSEIAARTSNAPFQSSLSQVIAALQGRWQQFQHTLAQPKHARTGVTIEALAHDVSRVVPAILGAKAWPVEKTLWELLDYYGQTPTNADVQQLAQMRFEALPTMPATLDELVQVQLSIDSPPSHQSARFGQVWARLMEQVETDIRAGRIQESQKAEAFWLLLLNLDLGETRLANNSKHSHTDIRTHWFPLHGWTPHKHDPTTGTTMAVG